MKTLFRYIFFPFPRLRTYSRFPPVVQLPHTQSLFDSRFDFQKLFFLSCQNGYPPSVCFPRRLRLSLLFFLVCPKEISSANTFSQFPFPPQFQVPGCFSMNNPCFALSLCTSSLLSGTALPPFRPFEECPVLVCVPMEPVSCWPSPSVSPVLPRP